MSVCLLVRSHISNTIHVHISRNFLYVFTAAVPRSSDDHNAIVMYFRFCGLRPTCHSSRRPTQGVRTRTIMYLRLPCFYTRNVHF